jgi:hypothetical protein
MKLPTCAVQFTRREGMPLGELIVNALAELPLAGGR